jgi:hypothetical protein
VAGEWKQLHNEELHHRLLRYQIKEDEMGGTGITRSGDEKLVQLFGQNTWRKENTLDT